MAKKKITGQTKLAQTAPPDADKLDLISNQAEIKPTSFRLNAEDKHRLRLIAKSVNDLTLNKKVSETLIIKALIYDAQKMKPEKLLNLIREIIL